jgi:hypothetical protein
MRISRDESGGDGRSATDGDRVAYADESVRSRDRLYVVAAALVAPSESDDVLEALRQVPPGRSRRFHWRLEREESRMRMLATIRRLRLSTFAACYCADRRRWSQRGRVQALKGLLRRLRDEGVARMVIETRGEHGDAEDRRVIYHAQRSGHASSKLTYCFDAPVNPFLWVPDAIAGAVGSVFADGIARYIDELEDARPCVFDLDP